MPWPLDDKPVNPQPTPGTMAWNYLRHAVASPLSGLGSLAQSVAQPFTNLFGNGGQEFWNGPQDPQAAQDMRNVLMTMYSPAAAPGAAAENALNVGIGLRHSPERSFGTHHGYDLLSTDTGKPLGFMSVTPDGQALHINNINSEGGARSIGPDGMRNVVRQLMGFYPEAKTIEGNRISGARMGGKYNEDIEPEEAPLATLRLRK